MNSIPNPSLQCSAPFPAACALNLQRLSYPVAGSNSSSTTEEKSGDSDDTVSYLPGEPSIGLGSDEVHSFLCKELETPILDEIYDRLWTVAKRSGEHIDPIHRQKLKGRTIFPAEDPKLHLVWKRGTIYIKPIPLCLLNHDVWMTYLCSSSSSSSSNEERTKGVNSGNPKSFNTPRLERAVAIGFLRSYAFLVQHRLDFVLAQECHLIPPEIDWLHWSKFIWYFRGIDDTQVSKRYHFGQLRASRLDWAIRIFRPQSAHTIWFYEIPYWSTIAFLEHAVVPLVYIYANLSVVLSSLQVVLTIPADVLASMPSGSSGLAAVGRTSWVFSILILFFLAISWVLVVMIPSAVLVWQFIWGFRHQQGVRSKSDKP